MNTGIIFFVGAIAVTGCATTGHNRSGDWGDDGFPPTHPRSKSEYPPSADGPAREKRRLALDMLEKGIEKSLPEESLPVEQLYAVIVNKADTEAYVLHNAEMVFPRDLDKACAGAKPLPKFVLIPASIPHPPDKKCWCKMKDGGDGFGLNEQTHVHCFPVPKKWRGGLR